MRVRIVEIQRKVRLSGSGDNASLEFIPGEEKEGLSREVEIQDNQKILSLSTELSEENAQEVTITKAGLKMNPSQEFAWVTEKRIAEG